MKPLSKWTVRLTLTGATLAVLLAVSRPARTAQTTTINPETPAAAEGAETILATKPATDALPANYKPSASLSDIIKLAQAGVSEEVLLTYVNNSNKAFNPSPEDIIFLNDLGVSEAVIKALISSKSDAPAPRPAPAAQPQPPAAAQTPVPQSAPDLNGVVAQPAYDPAPAPAPTTSAVIVTSPAQVTTVSYFYDTLAPYGNWVNVVGYGWCWQPTVAIVNTSWRPYFDRGRWVDSDLGWYWHSDYSWGATAFHYGRWHRHAYAGWVWQPDLVWAPAWVSWRYNSSYCGWAPLPPAAVYRPGFGFSYYGGHVGVGFDFGLSFGFYNFVPLGRVCDRTPRHHVVAANQIRNVYNNTTVNNTYITGNNNTVINQGVGRDVVVKAAQTPITRVTIKEALVRNGAGTSPDRIIRDRDRDVIYKPVLAKANVEHVKEQLRRAQDPRTLPSRTSTGVSPFKDGRADTAKATPTATPAPDSKARTTSGRGSNERIAELIEQSRQKSKGNPPAGPSKSIEAPAKATATVTTPAAPTLTPKPAISDQRLSRERVNQLVEEAKTKARERELSNQRGPVTTPPRPQTGAPVPKTGPARDSVTIPSPQPPTSPRQQTQPVQRLQPSQPRPLPNEPLAKAAPTRQSVTVPAPQPQAQPAQPVQRSQPNQTRNQNAEVLRERIQSSPAYQQYQQRSQPQPAPQPQAAPQTRNAPPQPAPAQSPVARPYNNERGGNGNSVRELFRGNSPSGGSSKDKDK